MNKEYLDKFVEVCKKLQAWDEAFSDGRMPDRIRNEAAYDLAMKEYHEDFAEYEKMYNVVLKKLTE